MTFQATTQEFLATSRYVLTTYLSDMSDADLLVSPVEGANHAAWQLGHLIFSEGRMIEGVKVGAGIELPLAFEQSYGKGAKEGAQRSFLGVSEYRLLMEHQRLKTLALLASLDDESLRQPAPEFMRAYAQTVSSVFHSIAGHEMMHAGQIAVIRRRLGKPVLI